jgi:hypothetical protein
LLLDVVSFGQTIPSGRFTPAQIEHIRRTVHRVPEVMVKVTGGGTKVGAVAAHFAYISRKGDLTIETDEGDRITDRDSQMALLKDWHLELSAGQYRAPRDGRTTARRTKLVHNIVLSMPSPTPPDKVLAAARKFALEKFALQHRYAMVLHTDQKHPHVHMVVKAESEDGRRLHIDKDMLRHWREDFARLMREQGIVANATPRVVRGQNRGKTPDGIFRAQRRGASSVLRQRVLDVAQQVLRSGTYIDPARSRVVQTRAAVIAGWVTVADTLERQGEAQLARDVRSFASRLPQARSDKELLAEQLAAHMRANKAARGDRAERDKGLER